jgi:polysaccharide export outer membrane protein
MIAHALRPWRRAALLLAIAALALRAGAGFAEPREALGNGDQIRVTVFQNPDLTTEARISERGTIVFPLIGEIALAGRTPAQAGERVASELKRGGFMKNPQVNVAVTQVRSVAVFGQVGRPGRYALEDAATRLTDILALAGGITPVGDDTLTIVGTRDGKSLKLEVNVADLYRNGSQGQNLEVQGGDTIYVPRAAVFYIYGEVQRAGAYRLEPDMRVVQALSVGGGLTPRGTERGLKIHRRMPDGSVRRIEAQLTDALQPDDVVYVRESLF